MKSLLGTGVVMARSLTDQITEVKVVANLIILLQMPRRQYLTVKVTGAPVDHQHV